jgi:biotin carboxylase
MLGLPTESPEAYDIAGDKGRTRLLEPVGADESFVLPSAAHLDSCIDERNGSLRFPLIVKPVIGWCSDCVSKVQNLAELRIAVDKASERHAQAAKPSTAVVVEPYIDGPEVDANFALLDGEIIFMDINDDFPSPADEEGASFKANFQETQNVIPSGLPKLELDAIRNQLRHSILRQGFKSGVFHCEARVKNSSVRYAAEGTSIVDLVPRKGKAAPTGPEVYLHEINARPPGYLESVAVLLAYGVDYYALRMLLAVGVDEAPRLRALSQPFLEGPQFHLSLMIIQQTKAGIMRTPDAAKEFLEKHAEMKKHVVDYYTRKKGGDVLEGPEASALWWIAYFSVISRVSRRELLERVDFIQRHFEYEIET